MVGMTPLGTRPNAAYPASSTKTAISTDNAGACRREPRTTPYARSQSRLRGPDGLGRECRSSRRASSGMISQATKNDTTRLTAIDSDRAAKNAPKTPTRKAGGT